MHEDADEASTSSADFVAEEIWDQKRTPKMKLDLSPPLSMSFPPGILLEKRK